jgi:plastocyanin
MSRTSNTPESSMKKIILITMLSCPLIAMAAQEHTVSQKGKAFSVSTLNIKVGDKVAFKNEDSFAHNVFSLTDAMPFDLGTYPQGQSKSVAFGKAGQYEIECAIHPEMKLLINVKP